MKNKLIIIAVGILTFPLVVFATPSSVDRIIDHIQPLIQTDFIKGAYFVATSTTASTFPYASSTSQTISGNLYLPSLTSGNLLYVGGTNQSLKTVATTSASCSGTVSCSSFTVLGSSPITLLGASGGSGNVSTSSLETAFQVPYWTSTAGTPALLSGGNSGFTYDGTKVTATYASTTALTSSGSAYFATSGGSVGIGTTSPGSTLSVAGNGYFAGNVNIDQYSSYNQAGNTILYASSTKSTLAVGIGAGPSFMTGGGTGNTAVGRSALASTTMTASGDTAVGYQSLSNDNGGSNAAVGYQALRDMQSGFGNIAMGYQALLTATSTNRNIAIGYQSMMSIVSNGAINNVGVGFATLTNLTTGSNNFGFGTNALKACTTCLSNVAMGTAALTSLTTGNQNVALGENAGTTNVTGSNSVFIGYNAARYGTSTSNMVAIGFSAGAAASNASYTSTGSTYIGYQSGLSAATSSDYNTTIGYQSGVSVTSGYGNILIGATRNTGNNNISTGGNNIGIGYNAVFPSATGNNQLNIGNFLFGTLPATTTTSIFSLPTSGSLSVGSSSPYAKFSIHANNGDTATTLFVIASSTASATTTQFTVLNTGNVGIGTTSPGSLLSVQGIGNFTTATSTFYSSGGINLTGGGCFAVNGTCISGGISSVSFGTETPSGTVDGSNAAFTVTNNPISVFVNGQYMTAGGTDYTLSGSGPYTITFVTAPLTGSVLVSQYATSPGSGSQVGVGTTGQFPYYAANGSTLTATSALFLSGSNIGVASTSPWGLLSVNANALAAGVPQFVVGSSTATNFVVANNGRVGVASTSPTATLGVAGTVSALLTTFALNDSAVCQRGAGGLLTVDVGVSSCIVSSKFLKHDITDIEGNDALNRLMKLDPVSFAYNETNKEDLGLIAESVAKIDPRYAQYAGADETIAGHEFKKGDPKGINWSAVTADLVKTVQGVVEHQSEQDKRIAKLEAEIAELKGERVMCVINDL